MSASIASRRGLTLSGFVCVGTRPLGDDVRPALDAPEAEHPAEKFALGRGKGPVEAGPAPEGFELAPRPVDPALEPALHHHDGVHGAGARTGDRFDGEAPVFEEGVEHPPRECAVGTAALQGQRHRLLGARPGETAGLARMGSNAAGHRAVPMNHAFVIDAPEGRKTQNCWCRLRRGDSVHYFCSAHARQPYWKKFQGEIGRRGGQLHRIRISHHVGVSEQ